MTLSVFFLFSIVGGTHKKNKKHKKLCMFSWEGSKLGSSTGFLAYLPGEQFSLE